MKFVTFKTSKDEIRAGWICSNGVVDMNLVSKGELPSDLIEFLRGHEQYMQLIEENYMEVESTYSLDEVTLMAPLPKPESFRDFMAFDEHVKNAAKRAGDVLAEEYYEIPVFYFSNNKTICGPGVNVARPKKSKRMDYELEIACIIGKEGKDIKAEDAENYIFGYTILTDWSARDFQMKEMKILLGPAKGKDFATSMGPSLVTKDEIEQFRIEDGRYDMEMTAKVNDVLLSKGNFKNITHSFAKMIERASEDVTLYPGDVLGSGTVGRGCILELGTEVHRFLEPGDYVELEITGLGKLGNTIV